MTDCVVTTPETLLHEPGPPCVIPGAHRCWPFPRRPLATGDLRGRPHP